MVVSFAMLLNLASVAGAEDKDALWGFIRRYAPDASPETHPDLDAAAGFAVRYYNDFVKPTKVFRAPTDQERAAMEELVGLPRRCRQGARRHRAEERAGGQGHGPAGGRLAR
jgi:lysyl-tRNA synthetase class 1